MDEKNIIMKVDLAVLFAKAIVLFGVTLVYVTPLFLVFYSIIFYPSGLISEHSIKCYILCYLIGCALFLDRMLSFKKLTKKD